MKKIVFMGTPAFAATVLEGLIASKAYEILAVVTQPDRAVGRKKAIRMTPVKEVALANNLAVYQPEKLSGSQEMTDLMALGADGVITAAYGQFLPSKLLNRMHFALNVHASLLPKYRGGAPIHYALINGDDKAGVTIMEMVKEMDAGDMVAQASLPILDEDNVGSLFEKLADLGRDLLLETLPDYLAGKLHPQPQDPDQVSFSPNITSEQERLDWNKSARALFNQVRGMYPWPIAHTLLNGQRFKIHQVQPLELEGKSQPGQIIEKTKKTLVVATGQGALSLIEVQPAGKPKMKITDFLNGMGQKLKVGDFFGT